jgi:dihydrofolate reductase
MEKRTKIECPVDELLRNLDMRAIAAMAENRTIGNGGALPWSIPSEMKFFREITANGTVLMGRKTFEAIGHPLPDRRNVVISSNLQWCWDGVTVVHCFGELLDLEIDGILWLCGGASLYGALLPACRELYLSVVRGNFDGDAKFPIIDDSFVNDKTILTCSEFEVEHYTNRVVIKR